MTSQIPAKIVLKSTTKMSLSERFTQYQKMRPQPSTVPDIRAKMASAQQASAANRRLAQQLANRPSVQAALGNLNKMSVKQRLGPSNVKARLNLNAVRGGVGGQRGGLGRGSGQRGGLGRGGQFRRGRGSGQGGLRGSPTAGGGRGGRFASPGGGFRGNRGRGRGGVARWTPDGDHWPRWRGGSDRHRGGTDRGGARGGRGSFGADRRGRGANRGRGGGRGRFQRGGRGGVRGRGRGRGANFPISKEQLDNQLEEYMSNTKANLDQEMDTYMAQADS
ncbi:hypothetical protein ACJMK2_024996 [Sinanodonta woodiana]|uniref:Chromatin target of PRMT1 protein C-terminal domain-containing protein n=1 Tax=Sinanodonta woodiana TaxID=1069815 RepID=A0ABD3XGL8_SINWO